MVNEMIWTQYDWIKNHINSRVNFYNGKSFGSNTLESNLPANVFDHYVKIFLHFYVADEINTSKRNETPFLNKKTGNLNLILAKHLAWKLDITFNSSFGLGKVIGKYGYIPDGIYQVEEESLNCISEVIEVLPDSEICYFVGDTSGGKYDVNIPDSHESWIKIDSLKKLKEYYKLLPYKFPSYVWNSNKDWCIFSPEDIEEYVIIGCRSKVYEKIMESTLDYVALEYTSVFASL
jgi:hypothetical protein